MSHAKLDNASLHEAATKIVERYLRKQGGACNGFTWQRHEDDLRNDILHALQRTAKAPRKKP